MQSFDTLPADVVFEILVQLPNLKTLHNVICIGRRIYDIYNSRRSLVLIRVYENELDSIFYNIGLEKVREYLAAIRGVKSFCQRAGIPRHDAVPLQLVVWKNMTKYHVHMWYRTGFCHKLILLCQATQNAKLASEIAEDARQAIINKHTQKIDPGLEGPPYRQEAERFTKWLANFYCVEGKPEEAIELLYHFCQSRDFASYNRVILAMLRLMKNNPGTVFGDKLLATLRSWCNQINGDNQPTFTNRHVRKDHCASAESYLHFVYVELNQPGEAMMLVQNAVNSMTQDDTALAAVVAMARRQVKLFKQLQQGQQALTVRKLVLDKMHTIGAPRIDSSMYLAWVKDYAADARILGFREIALRVEEQLLHTLNSFRGTSVCPTGRTIRLGR